MNGKKKILTVAIFALLALLVVGVITLCVILLNDNDKSDGMLVPDYPPKATDSHQEPMANDPGGVLETSEGGAGVNLTYKSEATVDLSEGKVTLYYANPSKSTQDMVVALVINDTVICRSERITPGNEIKELPLLVGVKEKLAEGIYENGVEYVVGCYDSTTNEKAVVELVGGGVVLTVVE